MTTRKPRLGSIYERGGIWWIKFYRNGAATRESSKSDSYQEAERLLKRRQGEIVNGKFAGLSVERIRMSALFDDLVEDYVQNKRATLIQLQSRLKLHLRPAFNNTRVSEFSTNHIKHYTAARLSDEAAPATVNRELEIVERALRLGAECDPPKVLRVIHVPMLAENNVRTGFLEDAGYIKLRDELPEYLRPLLVVGYHLGNRLGELIRLTWPQVDFKNNQIRLDPGTTKNKKGRTLPIYGQMPEWLLMQKAIRDLHYPDCPWVFFNQGLRIGEFRMTWKTGCKKAGCPNLLFHDLRRSAIRNMRLAGVEESVAMKISGHRTRAVFDRYDIVGPRDIREAAAKMERRLSESLGTISGTIAVSGQAKKSTEQAENASKRLN
jgi:integrase